MRHSASIPALILGVAIWLGLSGPADCAVIRVAETENGLHDALAQARAGDIVELPEGQWPGPVRIDLPIVLRGRGGVIDGGGKGTTLVIGAPGARIEGITVRNSGEDAGGPDACILIEKQATGAVVKNSLLQRCCFGIWVHETRDVEIVSNRIEGRDDLRSTDRGNGIHLFNASNLIVRDNEVVDARDGIYVSATENSLIESNQTSGVRFGVHYMYSYHNKVMNNVANDNVIGFALMESRYLVVTGNVAKRNKRNGLLFRDVLGSKIRDNLLEENGTGMFFYSSTENEITGNIIRGNELGMKIWAGTRRNRVEGNRILGNREQVFFVGAEDQIWGESGRGNIWGDYLGWDQDGDGIGDRPHRVDSFTARLLYQYPSAVLLLRSPALEAISHLVDRMPMLRAPTVIDRSPMLAEVTQ